MIKRDDWTTGEVINLILSRKICRGDGSYEGCEGHNQVVEDVADLFRDFQVPAKEFGALAYDTEKEMIVHIGEIPPEAVIQGKRKK